ncbi:MAG: Uracil-DNA glycosylase [uncultured bacterium (gcode 4)]|uniref:Uracil-DNA glycosylase n=1 Tax=uncultured bacterium (gcode 4) TaxID=1234023 RepID=K1YHJ6_9BACT|nr:MAG: Uracil-DNA glycosylase [uncultured bacterium (gcode 4)]
MTDINSIQIDDSWKSFFAGESAKPYFLDIKNFLLKEEELGHIVYPLWLDVFNAFNLTPFDQIKVVILGQDPYHGEWEAHGLCFSVQEGVKLPGSLKNIFKELNADIWMSIPTKWDLTHRAKQWVFLLNASLTVQKDVANSHKSIGWHTFTDAVIKHISDKKEGVIFLLRWAFAQNKKELIDTSRHFILETSHPSWLSVYRWFAGCKHFSKVNEILKSQRDPVATNGAGIDWDLN